MAKLFTAFIFMLSFPLELWALDVEADDAYSPKNSVPSSGLDYEYSKIDDINILSTMEHSPETNNLTQPQPFEAVRAMKKSEWVIAPVPFYNPSQQWGVALGAQYIFKHHESEQPSVIAGGGMVTQKKSYGGGLGYMGHLAHDRWRLGVVAGKVRMFTDFYGIGKSASDQNDEQGLISF